MSVPTAWYLADMQLTELLDPLQAALDQCWWYLNGYGVHLVPESLPIPPLPEDSSPDGLDEYRKEHAEWFSAAEEQEREYAKWINEDEDYRVGLPGWYSRYVNVSDTDWSIYYACQGAILPRRSLDWLHDFDSAGPDYFEDPREWSLPNDVVAILRIIDGAYWDVFFQDSHWRGAIQDHLRRFEKVLCEEFKARGGI